MVALEIFNRSSTTDVTELATPPLAGSSSDLLVPPRLAKFHSPVADWMAVSRGSSRVRDVTCSEREKISDRKLTPTPSDFA